MFSVQFMLLHACCVLLCGCALFVCVLLRFVFVRLLYLELCARVGRLFVCGCCFFTCGLLGCFDMLGVCVRVLCLFGFVCALMFCFNGMLFMFFF